jgi:hypothetical protein
MTTISATSDAVTLINVFTVEPANRRRPVELLTEATEVSVRRAPGFVSASLHRSTDGTKVTMYAQWRSIDASGPGPTSVFSGSAHDRQVPGAGISVVRILLVKIGMSRRGEGAYLGEP